MVTVRQPCQNRLLTRKRLIPRSWLLLLHLPLSRTSVRGEVAPEVLLVKKVHQGSQEKQTQREKKRTRNSTMRCEKPHLSSRKRDHRKLLSTHFLPNNIRRENKRMCPLLPQAATGGCRLHQTRRQQKNPTLPHRHQYHRIRKAIRRRHVDHLQCHNSLLSARATGAAIAWLRVPTR